MALCRSPRRPTSVLLAALLAAVLPVASHAAGEAPACGAACGDEPEAQCAAEGGLPPAEGDDEALHFLQRRHRMRLQAQARVMTPQISVAQAVDALQRSANTTLLGHFRKVLGSCSSDGTNKRCTKAILGGVKAVFSSFRRMSDDVYTKDELAGYQSRFMDLATEDSKKVVKKPMLFLRFGEWSRRLSKAFISMKPVASKWMVNFINDGDLGWKASYRTSMANTSLKAAEFMTGLEASPEEDAAMLADAQRREAEDLLQIGGANDPVGPFDVRSHWPECRSISSHVRFQTCPNCWSHSTALITETRICIATRGKLTGRDAWLSQSYIAACRPDGKDYCRGAAGTTGFDTINRKGVPTGGPDYRGNAALGIDTCIPQMLPHMQGVQCPTSCTSPYPRNLNHDIFKPQFHPRGLSSHHAQSLLLAKRSILEEGPILIGFSVHMDFYSYRSGVYQPSPLPTNRNIGGHAVTGMGFGPGYIQCVNSWGTSWGEAGAFKIVPEALNLGFFLPGKVTFEQRYPLPVP